MVLWSIVFLILFAYFLSKDLDKWKDNKTLFRAIVIVAGFYLCATCVVAIMDNEAPRFVMYFIE